MLIEPILLLILSSVGLAHHPFDYRSSSGLFPSVFNLAEGADIYSNTTCGASDPEIYCKLLSETSSARQCGVCDASREDKHHPIEFAIDGNENTWWQASSLQTGLDSNYATITIDLKEVFQVAYVLITTGISPRPGNWLLERSIDGKVWAPWQFFADSDEECWTAFGVEPRKDKPTYQSDAEVICTSYYSKLEPLEHAQIHVSLVNGRPGASGPSRTLVDFTQARYIRLRFLKLQLLPTDSYLMSGFNAIRADDSIATQARRYFYSIKDITIGGQCPCNGHANECPVDHSTMRGTLISSLLSSLWWSVLGSLYIPYIIYWSPSVHTRPGDITSPKEPHDPYRTGLLEAIVIICSLFVDALAISGLYKKRSIKHALLVPWLFYYPFIIMLHASLGTWNLFSGCYPSYLSGIFILVAFIYFYIWLSMYSVFHTDFRNKIPQMKEGHGSVVQPLTIKIQQN